MTIIFFTDPLVTTLMRSKVRGFIQKYVHEYYEIEISGNDEPAYDDEPTYDGEDTTLCPGRQIQIICPGMNGGAGSPVKHANKRRKPVRCITMQHSKQRPSPSTQSSEHDIFLAPEPQYPVYMIHKPSTSPLRSTDSSPCDRISPRTFQSISTASSTHRGILGIDPADASRVYVTYTHPRLATVIHYILLRVFRVRPAEEDEEKRDYEQPSPSMLTPSPPTESDLADDTRVSCSPAQRLPMAHRMTTSVYIPREPTVSFEFSKERPLRTHHPKRTNGTTSPESFDTINFDYGHSDSVDWTVVDSRPSSNETSNL